MPAAHANLTTPIVPRPVSSYFISIFLLLQFLIIIFKLFNPAASTNSISAPLPIKLPSNYFTIAKHCFGLYFLIFTIEKSSSIFQNIIIRNILLRLLFFPFLNFRLFNFLSKILQLLNFKMILRIHISNHRIMKQILYL